MLQRRHYEEIAEAMSNVHRRENIPAVNILMVTHALADELGRMNPKFNREKFVAACARTFPGHRDLSKEAA